MDSIHEVCWQGYIIKCCILFYNLINYWQRPFIDLNEYIKDTPNYAKCLLWGHAIHSKKEEEICLTSDWPFKYEFLILSMTTMTIIKVFIW